MSCTSPNLGKLPVFSNYWWKDGAKIQIQVSIVKEIEKMQQKSDDNGKAEIVL